MLAQPKMREQTECGGRSRAEAAQWKQEESNQEYRNPGKNPGGRAEIYCVRGAVAAATWSRRLASPFFIGLAERRHRQLEAMEKITPAARRKFSFPSPVDMHGERDDEQDKKGTDENPTPLQNPKV